MSSYSDCPQTISYKTDFKERFDFSPSFNICFENYNLVHKQEQQTIRKEGGTTFTEHHFRNLKTQKIYTITGALHTPRANPFNSATTTTVTAPKTLVFKRGP